MNFRAPVIGIFAIKILLLSGFSIEATAATLLYVNNFEQGSVGTEPGDEIWHPETSRNPPDVTIVSDPAGGAGSVMRVYMDGSSAGRNLESGGVYKHRALISFGYNINNAPDRGTGIRFAAGKEYWFGFRYFVPSGVAANHRNKMAFTFSPMGGGAVGESTMLLAGNNRLHVYPERYKNENNDLVENKAKAMDAPIKNGAWNSIIIHWVRNPYWLGKKLGQPPTGRFDFWVNGVEYNSGPVYAGTDREARGEDDPRTRYGVYFVEDRPGSYYEFYFDNIRIAEGADGKSLVDPSQSTSVEQVVPPASPILTVD